MSLYLMKRSKEVSKTSRVGWECLCFQDIISSVETSMISMSLNKVTETTNRGLIITNDIIRSVY